MRMTASKSRVVHLPLPSDDPKQRRPDISLAKQKLDWEPGIALQDGLAPTIAYFRDLLGT
jgi:UDP-glucuronate decarboxylase